MGLSLAATQVPSPRRVRLTTVVCRMVLLGLLCAVYPASLAPTAMAQHDAAPHHDAPHAEGHDGHHRGEAAEAWEGSEQGIAYSERNHHIAGFMVVLMGLAELSHVLRLSAFRWARLLLPSALMAAGMFLLIWSDHEAWPIGSLGFVETFAGGDHEILQHKLYGILAVGVGSVELFRRLGRFGHKAWASPLPLMAIVGGLMLNRKSTRLNSSHPSIS